MTVLGVHASRHGATEGIAARIAARLVDSGAAVDLRHVDEVETLDALSPLWEWPAPQAQIGTPRREAVRVVGDYGRAARTLSSTSTRSSCGTTTSAAAAGPTSG
jgi:hypothetical protein